MIYQILGLGSQAKSPKVSSQQRVNVFLEPRPDGDKFRISAYGTPTLEVLATLPGPIRGLHNANGRWFAVANNQLFEVFSDGTTQFLGTLLTATGRVGMADNGLQLMIVDGYGYILTFATNIFAQITSANYPTGTTDVTYQDTYFIVNADNGQFYVSAALDGFTWDATDFATAESNPDTLVRVKASRGELILCGSLTTEFWGNAGGAQFPYTNLRGSTSEYGLISASSLVDYDTSVMGLWRGRQGGPVVGILNGYQVQRVSNPDVESELEGMTLSEATAFSYMHQGHPFYQLNLPEKSFLYDGMTGLWSDVVGYGLDRHRGAYGAYFDGPVCSDYINGNLYRLVDGTSDNGEVITRRIRGPFFYTEDKRLTVDRLVIDMETGSVDLVSNPQIMLRVSKDGGRTWGMERWATTGKTGAYTTRVEWRRLGIAREWLFEITVTDPIKFRVVNAYLDAR